jgi:hypothetical protein
MTAARRHASGKIGSAVRNSTIAIGPWQRGHNQSGDCAVAVSAGGIGADDNSLRQRAAEKRRRRFDRSPCISVTSTIR